MVVFAASSPGTIYGMFLPNLVCLRGGPLSPSIDYDELGIHHQHRARDAISVQLSRLRLTSCFRGGFWRSGFESDFT